MWDLPGPGLESMSPALAGGFLTTVPPGKPPHPFIFKKRLLKLTYVVGTFISAREILRYRLSF